MILLIVAVIISIIVAIDRYVASHIFDGVSYDCNLKQTAVEQDEAFAVESVVENNKLMPMLTFTMSEIMPADIEYVGDDEIVMNTSKYATTVYTRDTYLLSHQRMRNERMYKLGRRGRYIFRGGNIVSGDLLGIYTMSKSYSTVKEIVVLPQSKASDDIKTTISGVFGDISVRRFVIEDPILTVGFREYSGREPQKSISWTQTARMGDMMVKVYDHTVEMTVTVMLNIENGTYNDMENCYSVTRYVLEELEKKHIRYDFITNANTSGIVGKWSYISEGIGKNHLMSILEGLGRATYDYFEPFENTIARASRTIYGEKSIIIITPNCSKDYDLAINNLRARCGGKVQIINVANMSNEKGA